MTKKEDLEKEHTGKEQPEQEHTQVKKHKKAESKAHDADKKSHDEEVEKLRKELKEKEEKLNELQDKYLRLSAEFDNYRKRTLREKSELIKTAGEEILKKILPVVDNFERGLKAMEQSQDLNSLKEGVLLIYNHFKDFLQQQGIKEIHTMNEPLNTDQHEAVSTIPAPSEELKGKIVDVIEKGYTLHDKVIRYSKVVVGE
jgi:molecular chaperone GrpE